MSDGLGQWDLAANVTRHRPQHFRARSARPTQFGGARLHDMRNRPLIVCATQVEGRGTADAVLGVGKVMAAMRTTELLLRARPTWLLLIGVCGAYAGALRRNGLAISDLCLVGEDSLADEGVALENGEFRGTAVLGLGDEGPFRADPSRTNAIAAQLEVPIVTGATVSTCSGRNDVASAIARRTGASVETMEGAAVLQVCQHFGVPAAQLRCVSNYTGTTAAWNLAGAVDTLGRAVRTLATAYGWELRDD